MYSCGEKLAVPNVKSLLNKAITDKEKAAKLTGALEDVSLDSFRADIAFKNKGKDVTFKNNTILILDKAKKQIKSNLLILCFCWFSLVFRGY
ncbi:MAG: hypothetical protein R6U35_04215 [Candidatus Humimicrobiaceae bacterium]